MKIKFNNGSEINSIDTDEPFRSEVNNQRLANFISSITDYNCPQFKCKHSQLCDDWQCDNCELFICECCDMFERCEKRIKFDEWEGELNERN